MSESSTWKQAGEVPTGGPLSDDTLGLLEGICSTRAIRRYRSEPVPAHVLRDITFAASRAPSASNRQPFGFVVLIDSPKAQAAKQLIARGAQEVWRVKRNVDRYDEGSGRDLHSPKAAMARTMEEYVAKIATVPVLILACLSRHRERHLTDGGSVYPACQNLLLAARALGYGGVMTSWHLKVEDELRELVKIPKEVAIAASITLGRPEGHHGPVRRRPLEEIVYLDEWHSPAPFAIDPPGTRHTAAGPRRD
jgi:nitroreductase